MAATQKPRYEPNREYFCEPSLYYEWLYQMCQIMWSVATLIAMIYFIKHWGLFKYENNILYYICALEDFGTQYTESLIFRM